VPDNEVRQCQGRPSDTQAAAGRTDATRRHSAKRDSRSHLPAKQNKERDMTRIIESFRTDFLAVIAATLAVVSTFLF
jgi:hypothetical protein